MYRDAPSHAFSASRISKHSRPACFFDCEKKWSVRCPHLRDACRPSTLLRRAEPFFSAQRNRSSPNGCVTASCCSASCPFVRSHAAESPYPAAIVRPQDLRVEVIDFLLRDQEDRAPSGRNRCRMGQGFFSSIRGRTILQGLNRGEVDLRNYMKGRQTLRRSNDLSGDDPGLSRQFLNCHRHMFFAVDLIECIDVSGTRINYNQFCSSHFSSLSTSFVFQDRREFELIETRAEFRNWSFILLTDQPPPRREPGACRAPARKPRRVGCLFAIRCQDSPSVPLQSCFGCRRSHPGP